MAAGPRSRRPGPTGRDRITATPVPKDGPQRFFADGRAQIDTEDLASGVTLTRVTG